MPNRKILGLRKLQRPRDDVNYFLVAIPENWIKEKGLSKRDVLRIEEDDSGDLRIKPQLKD
ncbi:hypothetical protein C9439_03035 [archaeon SCG-AAA382B04]|nr:hypothetical protein C9439_03035 [archaeon SCG-AAA382B04]